MNIKMMISRPIKAKILPPSNGYVTPIKVNRGRDDLTVGDSLYRYSMTEGDGHKYLKRKWHIVGETDCLYICEHRGKYAVTKECFLKTDYRFGLGLEKAN